MRVLVTGATGFVGRHVVTELVRRGHGVSALVRPSASPDLQPAGIDVVRIDLRAPGDQLARALERSHAVIHLAALSSGSWRSMFSATVLATENLLATMADAGWRGRLVHVSSFSVFGLNQLPAGAVVDESTPLEPHPQKRGDYAWTKSLQERIVRDFAATGPAEVVIVRPGAIYGPGRGFQHRLGRPVGSRMLLLLGGRSLMPLNYVENTAALLATCAEDPRAGGEVFNAVDPDPPTQREYLRWWRADRPTRIGVLPVPLGVLAAARGAYVVAHRLTAGAVSAPGFFDGYVIAPVLRGFRYSTQNATRVLGWQPPVSREEALKRTFPRAARRMSA